MVLDISIWAAFVAGLLSFLSPCVLPLVLPYLCFITGRTLEELTEPGEAEGDRNRAAVLAATFFVLGFATVFVSLGVSASAVGQVLRQHLDLFAKIAGAAIILMGLHFLGIFRLAVLDRDTRFQRRTRPSGLVGAYGMGLAFAFGWTPCIGPVLATILAVAASKESIGQGGFLLSIYSAGLGVPFILAAFGVGHFVVFLKRFRRQLRRVEQTMGALLVAHRGHVPHRGDSDDFLLAARDVSRACRSWIEPCKTSKRLPAPASSARCAIQRRRSASMRLVEEQLRHFSIDPAGFLWGSAHSPDPQPLSGQCRRQRSLASDLRNDRRSRSQGSRCLFQRQAFRLLPAGQDSRYAAESVAQDLPVAGGQRRPAEAARGPYPIFDNVTAIFSATPVVARTATYLYACVEWVEDAFKGKELLHEIYSRLLNPTSVSLANHIVDVEAGPRAAEYFAWNFNSGMAAIDATLAHLLGYQDIVLASRNVYGGSYQLLHDWYGKRSNLDVAVEWFEGHGVADFEAALAEVREANRDRLERGPPCLRFPRESHAIRTAMCSTFPEYAAARTRRGLTVICDATSARRFCTACCAATIPWSARTSSSTRIPRISPATAPRPPACASAATSACSCPRASA